MFADILSLIARLRAPAAPARAAQKHCAAGDGEVLQAKRRVSALGGRQPPGSTALCSGDDDLALLNAFKGAILTLKSLEPGECRLKRKIFFGDPQRSYGVKADPASYRTAG
jgi:hypothetical protein